MKKLIKITALLLSVVLLSGCLASQQLDATNNGDPEQPVTNPTVNPEAAYPQYYEKFSEVIGEDLTTVVEHLGLREADFQYDSEKNAFVFKDRVDFMNQMFEMVLYPSRDETGPIYAIGYNIGYEDTDMAAKAVTDLRAELEENYYPIQLTHKHELPELKTSSKDALVKHFTGDETWYDTMKWTITTDLNHVRQEIRDMFEPSCIALEFRVDYAPKEDRSGTELEPIVIHLTFKLSYLSEFY